VGPVLAERLRAMGLVAVRDALGLDAAELEAMLGPGRGAWLHERIRGIGSDVVEPGTEAKSMSREETFPRDLEGDDELERELMALAIRVASDLRRQALRARTVTVKIKDGDFRSRTASRTLDHPLESDRAILAVALELLATLRSRRRTGARLWAWPSPISTPPTRAPSWSCSRVATRRRRWSRSGTGPCPASPTGSRRSSAPAPSGRGGWCNGASPSIPGVPLPPVRVGGRPAPRPLRAVRLPPAPVAPPSAGSPAR
jgi:hypothetical protein